MLKENVYDLCYNENESVAMLETLKSGEKYLKRILAVVPIAVVALSLAFPHDANAQGPTPDVYWHEGAGVWGEGYAVTLEGSNGPYPGMAIELVGPQGRMHKDIITQ